MKKTGFLAFAAALVVALSTAQAAAQGGYVRNEENVARLQTGATTAKQVEELLGAPRRKQRDAGRKLEDWEYNLWNYGDPQILWVTLSDDGLVREVFRARLRPSN